MKKIKYLLILFILFFIFIINVNANTLNDLKVNIIIDNNGTLHVTEIWDMKTTEKTEFYKKEYNLGNMEITNFKVRDEDKEYTLNSNWDIYESFANKKYLYGINYVPEGIELCWGISEYGNKTYTLSYDIVNGVFSTSDAQVLYREIIGDLDFPPKKFEIIIEGSTPFEDTLDVWGYGYEGYAYVKYGKIYASNKDNTSLSKGEYVTLLVKFPLNYFAVSPSNTYPQYEDFEDILGKAKEGSWDFDNDDYDNGYDNDYSFINWGTIFYILIIFGSFISSGFAIFKFSQKYKFGPAGKKINMNEIPTFRDIPCNKDIFKAYFIATAYGLNNKKEDFMGSVLLKWLDQDKIKIKKTTIKKLFGSKEVNCIELFNKVELPNYVEVELYDNMREASLDDLLEENEFSRWAKDNYTILLKWFDKAEGLGRNYYLEENLVSKEKSKYIIDDKLKEEAIKLAGLKKFFKEFAYMDKKMPIEVKLWKEYLMFAQIFGMADKVAEQFKKLYPEIVTEINNTNMDLSTIIILNHMSNHAINSAHSAAHQAASSYSGGGGGFSSGGGGGGSFGGGGGGAR